MSSSSVRYLNQVESELIDKELMSEEYGFNSDILMELAGLSCASAISSVYPVNEFRRVLVITGPGNNGADGLVCARHLFHFGYQVFIVYPRYKDVNPYKGLRKQCEKLGISIVTELPDDFNDAFDIIVDAIFGYSFKGPIRSPFDMIIQKLCSCTKPIASIDIPSGWDVDNGKIGEGIEPDTLISLPVPKLGSKDFKGRFHFIGGRFVPPELAEKYQLNLPPYPDSQQFILINN